MSGADMHPIDEIIRRNRQANGPALPAVCSAHPDVLTAALLLAQKLDQPLLIEATSNQVNHRGGYTGQTPADFIAAVRSRAVALGCATDRLIFGGDHLGPQAWKDQPAASAMAEAEQMIAAYVEAGFTKIHLDCSEGCAGEPPSLADGPAAERAARLAQVAEATAENPETLRYVIGTEVPPPGGAHANDADLQPTTRDRASATLAVHERAFASIGLESAFRRVRALVVQPGLEFGPDRIHHFQMDTTDRLSEVLTGYPGICFEAHSTDYQNPDVFAELARRKFGILKVGPALTFAWREALYALSHIDGWLHGTAHVSKLIDGAMLEEPAAWQNHYRGSGPHHSVQRHFGYADRVRYYWTNPHVAQEVTALKERLDDASLPMPLLTQYLPATTLRNASDLPLPAAMSFMVAHVQTALRPYFAPDLTP